VALSVLMTTSTTIGCIFMTPLICKMVLGAIVPIDAMGIVVSTFQVVLAPIFLGVAANTLAPKVSRPARPTRRSLGCSLRCCSSAPPWRSARGPS